MADGVSRHNDIVEDDILKELGNSISRDWLDVGRSLRLDEDTLQNIKTDNIGRQKEAILQMLYEWKKVKGENATNGALYKALKDARRADLAHRLKQRLDASNVVEPKNQQKPQAEVDENKIVTGNVPISGALLPHYNMTRKPRGKCLILTYDKFKKAEKRSGNTKDMAKLTEIFETTLEFDVENELNLDSEGTRSMIQEMAETDHTNYDCFVCFICSHGDGEAFLTKDDGRITIQEILTPFKAGNCKSLAGKPKIFFINACLGESYQRMVKYEKDGPSMSADAGVAVNLSNYVPNEADFCVVLSTVPGYTSLRHKTEGTLFVQSFYDCIKEKYNDHHLVDILTIVNSDVNQKFVKIANQLGGQNPIGQVSTLVQTLSKAIYFSSL